MKREEVNVIGMCINPRLEKGDHVMPIPKKLSEKYRRLFVDEAALHKALGGRAGTMPIDIKAIAAVISEKLSNTKFMEGLVSEYMQAGRGQIKF